MFRCFPPYVLCASLSSIKCLCKPSLESCCGKLSHHHCLSFVQWLLRAGVLSRGAGVLGALLPGSTRGPLPIQMPAQLAAAAASVGRRGDIHRITAHVKGSFGTQLCVFCAQCFMAVLIATILHARRSIPVCSRCSCYGEISAIHPEGAQNI